MCVCAGSLEIIPEVELTITAHAGGSVLLPCNSTELTKAKKFKWRKYSMSKKKWDDLSSESNLLQMDSVHSSGNLSLLISHLSKEDEGLYRCDLGRDKYRDIKLIVEGKQHTPYCKLTTPSSYHSATELGILTGQKVLNHYS